MEIIITIIFFHHANIGNQCNIDRILKFLGNFSIDKIWASNPTMQFIKPIISRQTGGNENVDVWVAFIDFLHNCKKSFQHFFQINFFGRTRFFQFANISAIIAQDMDENIFFILDLMNFILQFIQSICEDIFAARKINFQFFFISSDIGGAKANY